MNIEHEILGEIGKKHFNTLKKIFTSKFGKPSLKKRLAISFWDPETNKNTDTRIRITNKVGEVMQKVGEWENKKSLIMKEITLSLPSDVDSVYSAFVILKNITDSKYPPRIIQHESYIFTLPDFEIKLARQFGKKERFIFEIEKTGNKSLEEFTKEIGLLDYRLVTDTNFWVQWNKEVNIESNTLTEREFKELLRNYL